MHSLTNRPPLSSRQPGGQNIGPFAPGALLRQPTVNLGFPSGITLSLVET